MKKYLVLTALSLGLIQLPNLNAVDIPDQLEALQEAVEKKLPFQEKRKVVTEEKTEKELLKELEKALKLSRTQRLALKAFKKGFDQFIKYIGKDKAKALKKQVVAYVLNRLALAAEGYIVLPKQEHMDLVNDIIQILKDEGVLDKAKGSTKELVIKFLQKLQDQQELTAEGTILGAPN